MVIKMGKIISNEQRSGKVISGKPKRRVVETPPTTPPVAPQVEEENIVNTQPLTIQSLVEGYEKIIEELMRQREVDNAIISRINQMDREISTITGDNVRLSSQNENEHKFIMVKLQECMVSIPDIVNEQLTAIFTEIQGQTDEEVEEDDDDEEVEEDDEEETVDESEDEELTDATD